MTTLKSLATVAAALGLLIGQAVAQTAAPAPAKAAPAAAPAAAAPAPAPAPVAAAPAPAAKPVVAAAADKPKAAKKRYVKRGMKQRPVCTKLDDPWDNICNVQKNAQVACRDLPTGAKKVTWVKNAKGKKVRKIVTPTENKRKICVDSYMRNV